MKTVCLRLNDGSSSVIRTRVVQAPDGISGVQKKLKDAAAEGEGSTALFVLAHEPQNEVIINPRWVVDGESGSLD